MQILVARDGEQFGPYTAEEVRDYLAQGALFRTDLAWHAGLAEWIALDQVALDCPPARTPPPPPKVAPAPDAARTVSPWTGLGRPDGNLFDASLLNGFIIIPANVSGDLTRDIAAGLLVEKLATPHVTQICFDLGGIERARADGWVMEGQDFEIFGNYLFDFERIGFLSRLAMANEQIHRPEEDPSGKAKTPYFEITTPLPERVEKVTGITSGPLGSRILIAEYVSSILFPPDMATIVPYLFTGQRNKAAFQRYDDGWRFVGEV